jgi:hypothetical protein
MNDDVYLFVKCFMLLVHDVLVGSGVFYLFFVVIRSVLVAFLCYVPKLATK